VDMQIEQIESQLESLSEAELQKVLEDTRRLLEEKRKKRQEEVKRQIIELADSVGLEVSFRVKGESREIRPVRRRSKAAPKYRHPTDPTLTWSGRGQMPRWLRDLVNQGHDKEEFRIRD